MMGFRLNCTWGTMSSETIAHYAKIAWTGLGVAWVSETGRVINAKTYRRAFEVIQAQCPNCGELISFNEDYLHCAYCGYGEDYPYRDED